MQMSIFKTTYTHFGRAWSLYEISNVSVHISKHEMQQLRCSTIWAAFKRHILSTKAEVSNKVANAATSLG